MRRTTATLLAAASVLLPGIAAADALTVCASGCEYTSINAAIDAADNGDVIVLSAETYAEGAVVDTGGKAITIRGATAKGGVAATILDGRGTHRVLQCVTGEGPDTRFENLVVQNGRSNAGGGMYNQGGSPTLANCRFIGNSSNQDGAAIHNSNASPTITNCTFTDNGPAREGGAIYHNLGTLTLAGCVFTNNQCEFAGGALRLSDDDDGGSSVTDCTFTGNSGESGGGISVFGPTSIAGCTFRGNTATSTGGAIRLGASTSVSDCLFVENSAFEGGAMLATFGNGVTLTSCVFERNTATLNGGAAYNNINSPTFQDCRFTGNTAEYGAGVRNVFCSPTFRNCRFTENAALVTGGAMTTVNGSPDISGSDIWCNTPDAVTGGYDDDGDNCINTDCTSCEEDDCLGDITRDGTVDGQDLGNLIAAWGTSDPDADLNKDGNVDGADLGQLFSAWGPCA